MLPKGGNPHRSRRIQLALLLGALVLASCGGPSRTTDPEDDRTSIPISEMQRLAKQIRAYNAELLRLESPLPEDWDKANEALRKMYPFSFWSDDWALIKRLKEGPDPADARKQLVMRGKTIQSILVFTNEKYDNRRWQEAFEQAMAQGEFGRIWLVTKVFQMLLTGQFMDRFPYYRAYLIAAGQDALDTGVALADELARRMPRGIVPRMDLKEVTVVILGFGPGGKDAIDRLLKHSNKNVRRVVLAGIGEAHAVFLVDSVAEILRTDTMFEVRMAAASALGRMEAAQTEAGKRLVEALKAEEDNLVRRAILSAIGDCHYLDALPIVMNALDIPNSGTQETCMETLWKITGKRITRKSGWVDWYKNDYPKWQQLRKRVGRARGNMSDPGNLAFVESLTTHEDWQIRATAARALGSAKDAVDRAGRVLQVALKRERVRTVRLALLSSAARLGYPDLVLELIKTVKDKDPEINRAALNALWALTGETKVLLYENWKKWEEEVYPFWIRDRKKK